MTIFGVPWDELALDHVQAFLDEADDEPFLWEAKGGGQRPPSRSVRKTACGFGNSRGGWLILGADQDQDGAWTLGGVDFGREEPRTWVDSVIRDGMNPVPDHDTKPLNAASGRKVAIVRVEPVGEPPCITRDGIVWQRVSGRTVPVTDPLVLARLSEQGERARRRAETDAYDALEERLDNDNTWIYQPSTFVFAIGLASVAYPPRLEQRLYSPTTKSYVATRFRESLKPDRHVPFHSGPNYRVLADSALAWMASNEPFYARWSVALQRTGAVVVTCTLHKAEGDQELGIGLLMEDVVEPAWRVAADLVEKLGGSGRTALRVRTRARITVLHGPNGAGAELGETTIEDWTSDVKPSAEEIEYVQRQLLRSAGFEEWEPQDAAQ